MLKPRGQAFIVRRWPRRPKAGEQTLNSVYNPSEKCELGPVTSHLRIMLVVTRRKSFRRSRNCLTLVRRIALMRKLLSHTATPRILLKRDKLLIGSRILNNATL